MSVVREMSGAEESNHALPKQRSQLFIAGLENPPIVFAGQINQAFTTHDMQMQFDYDHVTSGAFGDVEPNMTCWIGTYSGGYDLGICRAARVNPTSTRMYINETSEIAFADNMFFTVVDDFIPMPRHAKIVGKVIYMDGSIVYSDQNTNQAPVPIMGCDAVVDVESYPVEVRFPNIDQSWVFDSTITDTLLEATQGVVTDETTDDPLLTIASYPSGGRIRVKLTVTAANGKSSYGYRHVHVYDVDHRPTTVFNLRNCKGDYANGYWSCEVTMSGNVDISQIRDRATVVLFAKDWYGDTRVSYGQLEHRENIIFTGWVSAESIALVPDKSGTVTFRVEGTGYWMGKMPGYPPGRRMAKNTPASWVDVPKLTVAKAVFALMHWHCTVTTLADVYLEDDGRYATMFEVANGSLWSQIQEIAGGAIIATPGFDRYGRFFCEVDPQATPVGDRSDWPDVTTLTSASWQEKLDLRRRVVDESAQYDVSGLHIDSSGNASAFFALSTGHVYKLYGSVNMSDRLLILDQAHVNELAGLMMSLDNMEFEPYEIHLASNNRMFDVFPRMGAQVVIESDESLRGISYSGRVVIVGVAYEWNANNMYFTTVLEVENETIPELAVNGDIPSDAGIDKLDMSMPAMPKMKFPDLPMIYLPPTVLNPNHPKNVVLASTNFGVHWTKQFDQAIPIFQTMNDGLTSAEKLSIGELVATPSGAIYVMCGGDNAIGYQKIMVADQMGASFRTLFDAANYPETTSNIWGLGFNPQQSDLIAFWGGRTWSWPFDSNYGLYYLGLGNRSGTTLNGTTLMPHATRSSLVYNDGGWTVFCAQGTGIQGSVASSYAVRFTAGGAFITGNPMPGAGGNAAMHSCRGGTQDLSFHWEHEHGFLQKITNSSATATAQTIVPYGGQAVSASPTGTHLMGADGVTWSAYGSTDSGSTWVSRGGAITIGHSVWENCRDDNRWILTGGSNMKLTLNHGSTTIEKSGNLIFTAPLINIIRCRYIS